MLDQDTTGPAEEWRSVVGWEGLYSVSSWGRVRSDRTRTNTRAGRVLIPSPNRQNYLHVDLSRDGRSRSHFVHKLVCEAFVGPRPADKRGVNHIDTIKSNNHATNLEWATPKEQMVHASAAGVLATGDRHGSRTHPESLPRGDEHWSRMKPNKVVRGERGGRAKLTDSSVRNILASPLKAKELASIHGVSLDIIYRIRNGKLWQHIKRD